MSIEQLDSTSDLVPSTLARIGAPYGWRSSTRSEADWAEWLSHPLRQYWLITYGSETAGIGDLEPQPGGDVEIKSFGLLPQYVGQGLGGYALTLVIQQAWKVEPPDAESVRRVWLHTSTRDHPNALPNYERRGFQAYRTTVESR